ncbi:MAG: hypothetical protein Q8R39_00075 [bacterium]|nr:hypothetical protein [bacterium]MDZ4284781.1 hypothetical protein [Patescibacteria group bacterium]
MFFFTHFLIRKRSRTLLVLFLLALILLPLSPIGVERAEAAACIAGPDCLVLDTNSVLGDATYVVLTAVGWLLGAAGYTLDFVVQNTIVGMQKMVAPLLATGGGITVAWETIRNLANALFIFVILYIAISTILKANTHAMHQMLGRLIIAALLINFSLFFSKAIIDASNVLAIGFYTRYVKPDKVTQVSLSQAIMNPLKIVTIYTPPTDETQAEAFRKSLGSGQMITVMIVGSIFILITALVLFVIAVLLAVRFALLVLLMAFSPIGFVGFIVPGLSSWGKQWWHTLINQAFFAPVFFILMYVVIQIINSPGYFSGLLGNQPPGANLTLSAAGTGGFEDSMNLVMSFVVVIVMVLAALAIAKKMASQGSYGVTNWATKFAGGATLGTAAWLGRRGVGRVAHRIAESDTMKDMAAKSRFGGMRLVQTGLKGVAGSSFDVRGVAPKIGGVDLGQAGGKGGYAETFKKQVKAREEYAKGLGEGTVVDPERVRAAREEARAARVSLEGMQRQASGPLSTQADRDAAHQAALRSYAADEALERATRERTISRQEAYAQTSQGGLWNTMLMKRRVARTAGTRIGKAAAIARSKKELPQINVDIQRTNAKLRSADPAARPALEAELKALYERREQARSSEHAEVIARLDEQRGAAAGGAGGGAAPASGGAPAGGGAAGGGGGTTT